MTFYSFSHNSILGGTSPARFHSIILTAIGEDVVIKKYYPMQQRCSIPPVVVLGRILSTLGYSDRAMRLLGKHLNSSWWKSRSFAGYTPTVHDVFVATFAKSGTNWMMQIAQQISSLGAAEFDHIHDLVAWPNVRPPVCVS
ncbi:MAG: hypothetical protein D3903_16935 [Candidatus Electrothrix sp. GM3_4]|nr:hypothetical protein [Candidatus Electrothrix sp. GM3_4]